MTENKKFELKHNSENVGFVSLEDVTGKINLSKKNDKIGNMLNISFPIHYTCDKCQLCYKRKECYGMSGTYCFPSNQALYSENLKFFIENDAETIVTELVTKIEEYPNYKFFRWFAIGDIYDSKMIDVMAMTASVKPEIKFYAYTKKHNLVNQWIQKNGNFPENLNVMFSVWTNENGIEKCENPFNLTVACFIPYGREKELLTNEMFVCPCGNENWVLHCTDCMGCPYKKHKYIAFLEHSTKASKERDKKIREGRKAKKAGRGAK